MGMQRLETVAQNPVTLENWRGLSYSGLILLKTQ